MEKDNKTLNDDNLKEVNGGVMRAELDLKLDVAAFDVTPGVTGLKATTTLKLSDIESINVLKDAGN